MYDVALPSGMRWIFLFSFSLFWICAPCAAQSTTVILTRHAEKATNHPSDPDLSDAGRKRALELAAHFKNVPADLFFSTPFHRTRQTLLPWALQAGKPVTEYNPALGPVLIKRIKEMAGGTVVVSGHSNSIPDLVNGLIGENRFVQIPDSVYGDVWIVTLVKGGKPAVLQLSF